MSVEIVWPLIEEPISPRLPETPPPDPGYFTSTAPPIGAVVGRGLLRPFQRDAFRDWANSTGGPVLASSVGQILGTMSNSPLASGELPWRPEFGSNLYLLRNRQNDGTLADLARTYVVDALARWEPRVRVLGAQIKRMASNNDKTQNVIFIRVRYEIASSRTGSQTGTNTLEATVVV